jgi:hypothetical protein
MEDSPAVDIKTGYSCANDTKTVERNNIIP